MCGGHAETTPSYLTQLPQRWRDKAHANGDDFPTTTCSALSLPKRNDCVPLPVQTWVGFMLLCLFLVQCWTEGRWRMNSDRNMWKVTTPVTPPFLIPLCSVFIYPLKKAPANHRKCKFIAEGVINLFSFCFSFSNILRISLIPIPDLSFDWARSVHAFQSTGMGHVFSLQNFVFSLNTAHSAQLLPAGCSLPVFGSCGSQFWDVLPAWPHWSGPQGSLCPTGVCNTWV